MPHLSPELAAVLATAGGAIAGWVASGLAVVRRVDAIEKTLARIEMRMDSIARGY